MSFLVLRSWLGSSSFSVTAWLRRSNRCFCFSTSSWLRCVDSFSRISLVVMTNPLNLKSQISDFRSGHRVAALDEPARDRHLVRDAGQGLLGRRLVDAGDLEHHRAGLHDGHPVFRLALALTHAGFER